MVNLRTVINIVAIAGEQSAAEAPLPHFKVVWFNSDCGAVVVY